MLALNLLVVFLSLSTRCKCRNKLKYIFVLNMYKHACMKLFELFACKHWQNVIIMYCIIHCESPNIKTKQTIQINLTQQGQSRYIYIHSSLIHVSLYVYCFINACILYCELVLQKQLCLFVNHTSKSVAKLTKGQHV